MSNEDERRIIEINGIKMEVDMRTAKKVDNFKVGDPVKVLDMSMSYTSPVQKAGVIVGFAEFKKSPAIEIMVLKDEYDGVNFEFITIATHTDSKYEMIHYNSYESLFTQSNILDKFNRLIEKKELEVEELKRKKKYYIDDFHKAFEQIISSGDDD